MVSDFYTYEAVMHDQLAETQTRSPGKDTRRCQTCRSGVCVCVVTHEGG